MEKGKITGLIVVLIFIGVIAYFFISSRSMSRLDFFICGIRIFVEFVFYILFYNSS